MEPAVEPRLRGQEVPSDSSTPHKERSAERVESRCQSGGKNEEHGSAQKLHGDNWLSRKRKQNINCRVSAWSIQGMEAKPLGSWRCQTDVTGEKRKSCEQAVEQGRARASPVLREA